MCKPMSTSLFSQVFDLGNLTYLLFFCLVGFLCQFSHPSPPILYSQSVHSHSNTLYPVFSYNRIAQSLASLPLDFLLYRPVPYYARPIFTSRLALLSRNWFFPNISPAAIEAPQRQLFVFAHSTCLKCAACGQATVNCFCR